MKRTRLCILLILLILSGCTSKTEVDDEICDSPSDGTIEPLDLIGLWKEDDKDDTYIAADIREEKIGVFFVVEGDEKPWTYWVGTYEKPQDATDSYCWTSVNTYAGHGLLASSADTKEFTYKTGKLSFPVTIDGESFTVSLIRGEWDTSNIPENSFGSVRISQIDFDSLQIKDTEWIVKDNGSLHYFARLYNPSKKYAVEYPELKITARDADGILLGTKEVAAGIIHPGQEIVFADRAFSVDEMPSSVEFVPRDIEEEYLIDKSILEEKEPLEVVNTTVRSDKLVGEVYNPNKNNLDYVLIAIVFRDLEGNLIDTGYVTISDVKAGSNAPFSKSIWGANLGDDVSIEYYAYSR